MKKKIASRKIASQVKPSTHSQRRASSETVFSVHRIFVVSACVLLVVVGVVLLNKPAITQSVAGISVARGLFAQATVDLPEVDGTVSFNVYYKKTSDTSYEHAVRTIPMNVDSYTISYLTKGTDYDYKIGGVDTNGREFWFSPTRPLLNIESM